MIGLMDCNNFFVSCERLFRPDLKDKPVAVLSSNDGCIVARSQEVKDMGVPMGVPYFKIKDFCDEKEIVLFSSNFKLYRDISKRVMHTLKSEVDVCEVYSVDEAFFDVPGGAFYDIIATASISIRASGLRRPATMTPVAAGNSSRKNSRRTSAVAR